MPKLAGESFGVVVVALGVNDVMRLRAGQAWQADAEALVAALQRQLRPGGGIVLAGLPDMGGSPSLPQPMRTVLALHARHLDRRPASAVANTPSAIHSSTPPIESLDLYAEDGCHPGAEGYRRWAAHLAAAATALVSTETTAAGTGEHGRSVTA